MPLAGPFKNCSSECGQAGGRAYEIKAKSVSGTVTVTVTVTVNITVTVSV